MNSTQMTKTTKPTVTPQVKSGRTGSISLGNVGDFAHELIVAKQIYELLRFPGDPAAHIPLLFHDHVVPAMFHKLYSVSSPVTMMTIILGDSAMLTMETRILKKSALVFKLIAVSH